MSKSVRYNPNADFQSFKIKKAMPAHKLRDDLRDAEARSECANAKKYKEPGT